MKRALFVLIATLIPQLALAQSSRQTVQAEPYLTGEVCNAFMTAGDVSAETTILEHLRTPGQAYQLMFDYGLIFSEKHETAIKQMMLNRITLKHGTVLATANQVKAGGKPGKEKAAEIEKAFIDLVNFEGEQGAAKSDEILDLVLTLSAAHEEASKVGFVNYAAARNLVDAIKRLPRDHVVRQTFQEYSRAVVAMSYLELLKLKRHTAGANWSRLIRDFRGGQSGMSYVAGGALITGIATLLDALFTGVATDFNYTTLIYSWPWPLIPAIVVLSQARLVKNKFRATVALKSQIELLRRTAELEAIGLAGAPGTLSTRAILPFGKPDQELVPYAAHSVATLEDAAARNSVVEFTPVDLTYLGHAEMMDLKLSHERLMEDFGRNPKNLEAARVAAENIRKDAANFDYQIEFRNSIQRLLGNRTEDVIKKDWEDFEAKLAKVKASIEKIRELPYALTDATTNTYTLNLGRYLVQRLLRDMDELSREELNTIDLDESLRQMIEQKRTLSGILERVKRYDSNWSDEADNVLLYLETQ